MVGKLIPIISSIAYIMKVFNRLMLLILMLFVLGGCSRKSNTLPTHRPKVDGEQAGVMYGVQERAGMPYFMSYAVDPDKRFSGVFFILNQLPVEQFLFTCLVDYVQAPCNFQDSDQLLYSRVIANGTEANTRFTLPLLAQGFHDVIVMGFKDPDTHDLDVGYRINTDINHVVGQRLVLLSGADRVEPPHIPSLTGVVVKQFGEEDVRFEAVVLSKGSSATQLEAWTSETISLGDVVEYNMIIGNMSDEAATFMLTRFLNYLQIPIVAEQLFVQVVVPANSYAIVPSELSPAEVGVNELSVIYVREPYQMLEVPALGNERQVIDIPNNVLTSIRVGIEVAR